MSFKSVQSHRAMCRSAGRRGRHCYGVVAAVVVLLCGCNRGVQAELTAASVKTPGKESTLAASDWPVFRGNATATGVAEDQLTDSPQFLWKYTVTKGSFEATPVVADGTVYIGDMDGTFYAIDLLTHEKKWTFDNGQDKAVFNTAAAVKDGLAYIGDMDGNFFCLDAKTGEKKWTAKAEAEINSAANFHGGNVLFGSQDATLYCLDAKTGEEKWKHQIGDQIRCSPTVVENRCFLAGCDGKLHVIDLANGEEAGDVEIGAPTGTTPVATGSLIYFGTEGATFFCIDWKQLKEIWHWTDKVRSAPIRSSAALTPQIVIFGGQDKIVHAFKPDSGDPLWHFQTKGRVDSSPVIVGKRVYVG